MTDISFLQKISYLLHFILEYPQTMRLFILQYYPILTVKQMFCSLKYQVISLLLFQAETTTTTSINTTIIGDLLKFRRFLSPDSSKFKNCSCEKDVCNQKKIEQLVEFA